MKRKALIIAAIACVIGAVISLISTSQYLRIHNKGLEEKSYCSISELVDCDTVSASSYATFAKVPVAWMGFLMYFSIGSLALFCAASKRNRKATLAVAWFLSIFSVLYSIHMGYVLFYVLQMICIDCIVMYIINFLIMFMLWWAMGVGVRRIMSFAKNYLLALFGRPSQLGFKPRPVTHAIILGLIFGVGWLTMYSKVLSAHGKQRIPLEDMMKAYNAQSLYDIKVDPQWPMWGNPDAKVTIVEYSEFECPFCRLSAYNFRPYLQEFKKDIRYYFVHYPLDNKCNPYLNYPMHPKSCMVAEAAVCAQKQGHFWSFHDELFRLKRNLNKANVLKLAKEEKMNLAEFNKCWDSPQTKEQVLKDIEDGYRIHIRGVPAIFINGKKLKYWRDPKFVRAVIKEEIKKAEKP